VVDIEALARAAPAAAEALPAPATDRQRVVFGRIRSLATKASEQASASLRFANAQVTALTALMEARRKAAGPLSPGPDLRPAVAIEGGTELPVPRNASTALVAQEGDPAGIPARPRCRTHRGDAMSSTLFLLRIKNKSDEGERGRWAQGCERRALASLARWIAPVTSRLAISRGIFGTVMAASATRERWRSQERGSI
jgi:hypothetical protein